MHTDVGIWNPGDEIWRRLRSLAFVAFRADSDREPSWTGTGRGTVTVEAPSSDVFVFSEEGTWKPIRGRPSRFTNVFRWTLITADLIRLEHLRFGVERPVHLADLSPDMNETWRSALPHICGQDCYSISMRPHPTGVDVWWTVSGPEKKTSTAYEYRWYDW